MTDEIARLRGLLRLALQYVDHPDVQAIGFALPACAVAERIRLALEQDASHD